MAYLSGGEQTTINSTITELYPALCFNNKKNFTNAKALNEYILGLVQKDSLFTGNNKKSFVDKGDADSAMQLISDSNMLRPQMRDEKLNNAIGILKYLYEQDKIRKIERVVWGYRAKPSGVPSNHPGDIFLIYAQKRKPKVLGISLKAGTAKSAEPKLNTYVRTTLTKPYWKKSSPNAENQLKRSLWNNVYSKLVGIPKSVQESNWINISGKVAKVNDEVKKSVLKTFKKKKGLFESLYVEQNKQSRMQLVNMINKDFATALEWIENEFRLEKPKDEVDVPLLLVKAVGNKATEQGDKLARIFPKITKIKAYLNTSSVQEWFIDVFAGQEKLTLLMTIRSDSEYREEKQKGKLGAYMQLKLLYRGYK